MLLAHEILEKTSKDFFNKEVIVCENRRMLYKDLDEASTGLANFLVSQGVNCGDRIGIFSNKNIEEIIAIFAILKIGCIFVHINPQFKEKQLSYVISNCDIRVLFVNDMKAGILNKAFPESSPTELIIALTSDLPLNEIVFNKIYYLKNILTESSKRKRLYNSVKENDIASIIYTSGSTGMPKGVVVTHRILYDSTIISASVLNNNENDRLISVTPFSFDGALSQLFTSILVGGTIVLQKSNFPKDIVKTLLSEKITGFHGVPSLWNILLQNHSPFAKHGYSHLRYISIIGEAFSKKQLMKLKNILKDTDFFIMYGTTEAFRSTFLSPKDFERKITSVGKPFPGVDISIVDAQNNTCRPGEIGEIVHKGVFISPGYWNDPEKSNDIFKYNSLYTRDLGKIDDEGYLYFLGRKDGMIKTNGYRVSPKEIEDCLYGIEEIKEVAITGTSDEMIGNKIKAVVVCRDENTLSPRDVISHCKKILPNYMVPEVVEFLDVLPKTSSGKINRSLLD
ncbi:MAG: AMP-binding protein [Desulfobacteraceae bacterium]|nr:AMP-binding protein [Desulfobacteraceae bacterium]MBC2754805.1 AMP-binding protein [Desulfobacteraceae bacterium]